MHSLTNVLYRTGASNPNVTVRAFPDRCPQCHQTGVQSFLGPAFFAGSQQNEVILTMRCPNHACSTVYLAFYTTYAKNGVAPPHTSMDCGLTRCLPMKPLKYNADPVLGTVSKEFIEIATQAKHAESAGLLHVCGPGYRKALEFLVKDFLINHTFKEDAEKQANVRKMALANVIASYITNERIRGLAARAAWIGNDETHYERVQGDHDLEDLKNLLHLTALYLAAELHADHYTETLNKPSST